MRKFRYLAAATLFTGLLTQTTGAIAAPAPQPTPHQANAMTLTCAVPSTHDPAVIKELYRIGLEREVSAKVMLAMFEAGWVESHMNNLPCGHSTSVGVFQQRPDMGWCDPASLCQDVTHATNEFLDHAERKEPNCGAGCTAGELAQRVQISAYPDRYDEAEGKAWALIEEAKAMQEPKPVTVSTAGGSGAKVDDVFWSFFQRADNRALRHTYTANVGWEDHDMAGSVVSAPSTVALGNDLWVFARDGADRATYRVRKDAAWTDWLWLPGTISGAPATGTLGERLFVVARTGTGLAYRFYDTDTGWNASGSWLGLGQPAGVGLASDPVIGALGNRIVVVARGSDGYTWLRWAGAGSTPTWSAWTKLSGAVAGTPAVASADKQLHIFVRTPGGEMRYHTFTEGGTSWIHYRGLGSAPEGTFTGSPAAISFGGLLTVYVRNDAGQLLYRDLRGATWKGWLQLGRPGDVNVDSSPVAMQNSGTRYVAARGTNQLLYSRSYRTDTGWSGWVAHPGKLAPMR